MKIFFNITALLISILATAQFSENFGAGQNRVLLTSTSATTAGFQNNLYGTSYDCYVVGPTTSNLPFNDSTPYVVSNTTGASGGGAIELIDDGIVQDSYFVIDNINTLNSNTISLNAKVNLQFLFGFINGKQPLHFEYFNPNASNPAFPWVSISPAFPTNDTFISSNTWRNYTYTLPPAAKKANLKIKISPNNALRPLSNNGQFFTSIDDIKTDNALSNNDFEIKNVKIYPNPANTFFTIDLGNEIYTDNVINIYNVIGQEVYSNKIINSVFDINKTWNGEGVYFLKILNKNGEILISKKIIFI
jgi:hypothetical protein